MTENLKIISMSPNMMKKSQDKLFRYFAYLLLVALAFEVIVLVRQNKQLKTTVYKLNQSLLLLSLQKGDLVSPFIAKDLNGNPISINYKNNKKKTILLAFSTECHICKKNIPFWNNLFDIANPDSYRIIGVSKNDIEDIKSFIESVNVKFPILLVEDTSFWWDYKFFRLPQTIIINEHGEVMYSKQGLLFKVDQIILQ